MTGRAINPKTAPVYVTNSGISEMGKCKLCCEEKELCLRSHIIPNFMYRELFDEKNRLLLIQNKNGLMRKMGIRQSGEFEGGILCKKCDNKLLGGLDRYASLVFYDGYPKVIEFLKTPDGMRFMSCAELDYSQFKLFLLSILWRASISSRPLFQDVSLGPYEEPIRRMILTGDPGEKMVFPCLIMTYSNIKNLPRDLVIQPSRFRLDGGFLYNFLISGMIYIFFVTKRIIPDWISDAVINPKGEMKIIFSPPKFARRAFGSMIGLKLE